MRRGSPSKLHIIWYCVLEFQVGTDTYLFWGDGGGDTINSAALLQGVASSSITTEDFV